MSDVTKEAETKLTPSINASQDDPKGAVSPALLKMVSELRQAFEAKSELLDPDKLKTAIGTIIKEQMKIEKDKWMADNRSTHFAGSRDPYLAGVRSLDDALSISAPKSEMVKEFHRRTDEIMLLQKILSGAKKREVNMEELKSWVPYKQFTDEFQKTLQAGANPLSPWVPTGFSASLEDEIHLALRVAAMHRNIPMPTNPYTIPTKTGGTVAKLKAEGAGVTKTDIGTANVTLTAKNLSTHTDFTDEADEDSIIPVLPVVRMDIVDALADAIETTTINGDLSGTHPDDDIQAGGATRVEKAWDGYRAYASDITASPSIRIDFGGAGAFNEDTVRQLRSRMGRFGVDIGQLFWLLGVDTYNRFLKFPSLQTLDKMGPQAIILRGQLGAFDGIPIIVSEFNRQDLDADGFASNPATGTTTSMFLIRKDTYLYGTRRGIRVETDRDIDQQRTFLVSSGRWAMTRTRPLAEPTLAQLFNIPLL